MTEIHFASEADRRKHFANGHFTRKDLEDHTRLMGQFVLDQIKIANAPLLKRIRELETVVSELQNALSKAVAYHGTWQRASDYKRGAMVNHASAGWVAITDVGPNEEPGKARSWQLFLKSETRLPTSARPTTGSIDRRPTS